MKNKKFILLIALVIALTGCKAEYNLKIQNDTFSEQTNVYTDDMTRLNLIEPDLNNSSYKSVFDEQYTGYTKVMFNDPNYNFYKSDPQSGVEYYTKTRIDSQEKYGISYSYEFSKEKFVNSTAIKTCYKEFTITTENNFYILATNPKAECMENYKLLTDITINIELPYKVISSNADKVNNNIYIWNITKENYKNKSIRISYNINENKGTTTDKTNTNNPSNTTKDNQTTDTKENGYSGTIYFLLVFASLGLITLIIYLIYRIRNKKLNQI